MAFFASRWRGDVPLKTLFWRDMMVVGTAINAAVSVLALIMLGLKAPLAAVLAVHFAPVPYNLFLTLAVWRTGEKAGGVAASTIMLAATAWLIVAAVI